jgi:hypothetical protein
MHTRVPEHCPFQHFSEEADPNDHLKRRILSREPGAGSPFGGWPASRNFPATCALFLVAALLGFQGPRSLQSEASCETLEIVRKMALNLLLTVLPGYSTANGGNPGYARAISDRSWK